jgi:hypothetical protein
MPDLKFVEETEDYEVFRALEGKNRPVFVAFWKGAQNSSFITGSLIEMKKWLSRQ